MALLFGGERATKAVLSFLRKTKVGQMVTILPRDEAGEEGGEGSKEERAGEEVEGEEERAEEEVEGEEERAEEGVEGEEGGPGPPLRFSVKERPGEGRIQDET